MSVITTKYETNNSFGRVVDVSGNSSTQPNMRIKNLGPVTVFVTAYTGSSADGGTDTVQPGFGYPLLVGESLKISNSKIILQPSNDDATFTNPSTVWVVFF